MGSEKEGLTMGDGIPNLVDHNGGPVKSSDVTNNAVGSSERVQSESLAAATQKHVAQENARRQLPLYEGVYTDSFIQGFDATLT